MTVEVDEPENQFYTVVKRGCLNKIVKKYYGNIMKYPIVFEANKQCLGIQIKFI